jgi:NAD(P)-dependent dehydrogenase (short-subunit alcohol dehydrogenase family)
MRGRVCVITGATSGLGRASAVSLGAMGADLALVGRNERAALKIVARLRSMAAQGTVEFFRADLSDLERVRQLGAELRSRYRSVDVLINNAGARFSCYQTNKQGLERTFATNHLSHFLLTAHLLEPLLRAPAGRILTIGSGAHATHVAGEWLSRREIYDRKAAYSISKLANIMFAYELARRLTGTAVSSNALDPGSIASRLGRNNGLLAWVRHLTYSAMKGELQSSRQAAKPVVWLVSAAELEGMSGKCFRDRTEIQSSSVSYDRQLANELWSLSVSLTGLTADVGVAWKFFEPFSGSTITGNKSTSEFRRPLGDRSF